MLVLGEQKQLREMEMRKVRADRHLLNREVGMYATDEKGLERGTS